MGARYLTDLADVLRAAGLPVIEVDEWESRGRSSGGFDDDRPWCIMWHHTASDTTPENDVSYIVYGCPDAPVSNLYLERDGTVWVCAAGATNTNGKGAAQIMSRGVIPADQMNTHAIGIEAANDGLGQEWPQVQIDAYFRLNNALAAAYGLTPGDCCTHHEYAKDRKIDPAVAIAVEGPWTPEAVTSSGTWSVDDVREECWLRSENLPPIPGDDMTEEQARQLEAIYSTMTVAQPGFTDPGGAQLNAGWAALWAYQLVAGDIYRMLVDIQSRVTALET